MAPMFRRAAEGVKRGGWRAGRMSGLYRAVSDLLQTGLNV